MPPRSALAARFTADAFAAYLARAVTERGLAGAARTNPVRAYVAALEAAVAAAAAAAGKSAGFALHDLAHTRAAREPLFAILLDTPYGRRHRLAATRAPATLPPWARRVAQALLEARLSAGELAALLGQLGQHAVVAAAHPTPPAALAAVAAIPGGLWWLAADPRRVVPEGAELDLRRWKRLPAEVQADLAARPALYAAVVQLHARDVLAAPERFDRIVSRMTTADDVRGFLAVADRASLLRVCDRLTANRGQSRPYEVALAQRLLHEKWLPAAKKLPLACSVMQRRAHKRALLTDAGLSRGLRRAFLDAQGNDLGLLQFVANSAPGTLLDLGGPDPRPAVIVALAESSAIPDDAIARLLAACLKRRGAGGFLPFREVLPARLRRMLLADDATLALLLAKPTFRFAEHAAQVVSPQRLLPFALANPVVGTAFDGLYPLSARLSLAGEVRALWPQRPGLRAAGELALVAGTAHGKTLRWLSRELTWTKNETRRGRLYDAHYRTHFIPKRSGGERRITAPAPHLRRLQRALYAGLLELSAGRLHAAATGFRPGLSIVDNAARHVGRPTVVNVDIQGFFPNTRFANIRTACRRALGHTLSNEACVFLAELASFDGGLPVGAPTSPLLGNLVLAGADAAFAAVAARDDLAYTRYADDLTFSGGEKAITILPFVKQVLSEYGYVLDDAKTNIFRRGRRQVVTGLVVNERVTLARPLRKRLRAVVHARCRGEAPTWAGKPMSDAELFGWLAFVNQAQPALAAQWRAALTAAGVLKAPAADDVDAAPSDEEEFV